MGKTNELWRDVTGLVWDIESMKANNQISEEKMMWLIPDGAMLDGEGRKRDLTGQLLSYLGITENPKFSEVEVETDEEIIIPDSIEVEGVTYYKTEPDEPTEPATEGKKWTLATQVSDDVTYYAWVQTDIPDSIEVEGVTYYKTEPDEPTEPAAEGKKWALETQESDGVTYYAWVQTDDEEGS